MHAYRFLKISLLQIVLKNIPGWVHCSSQHEYITQHSSRHLVQNNELNCRFIFVLFMKIFKIKISKSTSGGKLLRKIIGPLCDNSAQILSWLPQFAIILSQSLITNVSWVCNKLPQLLITTHIVDNKIHFSQDKTKSILSGTKHTSNCKGLTPCV